MFGATLALAAIDAEVRRSCPNIDEPCFACYETTHYKLADWLWSQRKLPQSALKSYYNTRGW